MQKKKKQPPKKKRQRPAAPAAENDEQKKILRQLRQNQKLLDWERQQPGYGTGEGEESYRNRERNLHAENAEWQRELQRRQDAKDREERDKQEMLELLRRIVSGAAESKPSAHSGNSQVPKPTDREKIILRAIAKKLKGLKYCAYVDSHFCPPNPEWKAKGWPGTYAAAYKKGSYWQNLIQRDKSNVRRRYSSSSS